MLDIKSFLNGKKRIQCDHRVELKERLEFEIVFPLKREGVSLRRLKM
jgi:hypothetical protein